MPIPAVRGKVASHLVERRAAETKPTIRKGCFSTSVTRSRKPTPRAKHGESGNPWTQLPNVLNAIMIVLIVLVMRSGSRRAQGAATVLCGTVLVYGMLFVWSQPGD